MIPKKSNNIWDFACDHPIVFGLLAGSIINVSVEILRSLFSGSTRNHIVSFVKTKDNNESCGCCEACKDNKNE